MATSLSWYVPGGKKFSVKFNFGLGMGGRWGRGDRAEMEDWKWTNDVLGWERIPHQKSLRGGISFKEKDTSTISNTQNKELS